MSTDWSGREGHGGPQNFARLLRRSRSTLRTVWTQPQVVSLGVKHQEKKRSSNPWLRRSHIFELRIFKINFLGSHIPFRMQYLKPFLLLKTCKILIYLVRDEVTFEYYPSYWYATFIHILMNNCSSICLFTFPIGKFSMLFEICFHNREIHIDEASLLCLE